MSRVLNSVNVIDQHSEIPVSYDFWTTKGLFILGNLVEYGRSKIVNQAKNKQGLSQRELRDFIYEKTRYSMTDRTIGNIENSTGEPKHNTVVALASAGFIRHPKDDRILTKEEIFAVASGKFNPYVSLHHSDSGRSTDINVAESVWKKSVTSGNNFAAFLRASANEMGIQSEEEFVLRIHSALLAYQAEDRFNSENFRALWKGDRNPTEEEIGFLATFLRDRNSEPYEYTTLLYLAGLIDSGSQEPIDHS